MQLHIELEKWDDASTLARTEPDLMEMMKLPYANWLVK